VIAMYRGYRGSIVAATARTRLGGRGPFCPRSEDLAPQQRPLRRMPPARAPPKKTSNTWYSSSARDFPRGDHTSPSLP